MQTVVWHWRLLVSYLLVHARAVFGQDDIEDGGPGPGRQVADNVPPPEDFQYRSWSGVAVLGDYIYFDGGSVSQANRENRQVNATLAIDLTQSWDTASVEIIEIEYEADTKPTVEAPALVIDRSSGVLYSWGGLTVGDDGSEYTSHFWKFTPDGQGRGDWEDATPDSDYDFLSAGWTRGSASVSTDEAAFMFGGYLIGRQAPSDHFVRAPGFFSLDFESQEWSRNTSGPYSPTDTMYNGAAVFTPGHGPNGLVFAFDGTGKGSDGEDLDRFGYETLHFMDPVTREWHSQNVTGDIPPPLSGFCAVGASAGNNTFDIFVYGGGQDSDEDGVVRVLTLPGFHWTTAVLPREGEGNQGDDVESGRARHYHQCATVGSRHLLSWGGTAGGSGIVDPFRQGIGVFDMSELSWTHRYNASAKPYQQHASIRKFYDEGKLDDVVWSSPEVRELFTGRSGDSESDSPRSSPTPGDASGSGSVPIGAIIGGVVGGVVVIAAVVAIWFLWKRGQRKAQQTSTVRVETDGYDKHEAGAPGHGNIHEAPDSQVTEMHAGYLPPEMNGSIGGGTAQPRWEVDGIGIGETPWHERLGAGQQRDVRGI